MEELIKELEKLIFTYSINHKLADKKFTETALELCINAFNIRDYVEHYDVDVNCGVNAGYYIDKRYLVMDIHSIINDASNRIFQDELAGIKSTEFLNYFKTNANIVYGIIHELTHACQYKKCLEEEDTFERTILEISLDRNLSLLRNEKLSPSKIWYYKALDKHFLGGPYYEACPSERMADIKGLEYERDIAKLVDPEVKGHLETYTELRLLNSKINGYGVCSPTTFVTIVNEQIKDQMNLPHMDYDMNKVENMYFIMANKRNLSLDERIWLGLPIKEYEKQKVYSKRKELQDILLNNN